MKSRSSASGVVLVLLVLAALGAAPYVLQALLASETAAPLASIPANGEEKVSEKSDNADNQPVADLDNPANQLALAPDEATPRVARKNSPNVATTKEEPADSGQDPFAVPSGNVDELINFIINVQKVKPQDDSEESQVRHTTRIAQAVITASERILAANPSEEQAQAVASVAFQAMWHLVDMGDESALDRIGDFVGKLENDPRPSLATLALKNSLLWRIADWNEPTAEQKQLFEQDFQRYMTTGQLDQEKLQLAMSVGEILEELQEHRAAATVYESLVSVLPRTEETEDTISRMQGVIRRLHLPGNFMEISGTTLAGKSFDWNAYRGKVVLVDFWATWCGPCIKELPNVLRSYEKYHDKGFDVVGISLDSDQEAVEDFVTARGIPWVTLLEKNPQLRGWNNPLVDRYGISGIPAAILVDQEGKVVSLAAYGEVLEQELARLLGPAE